MEKAIEVKGLKKSFGNLPAVKGIDFYVEKGTLFAFLGPNGAGKSTTIDIICTLLKPDAGEVLVSGNKLSESDKLIRSDIGVVFQENLLDGKLTVMENLLIRGASYGLKKTELKNAAQKAIELVNCDEFANRPYGKLSGGQRRRADIARAFINTPKILFMDEPTTGLDPHTRKIVWETVRSLQKNNNLTVFLTTHYMEEAAQADYVAVIDNGLIAAKGTPSELREKYSSDYMYLKPKKGVNLKAKLDKDNIRYQSDADFLAVKLDSTLEAIPLLQAYKDDLAMFEVKSGNMDDAFINITGGGIL